MNTPKKYILLQYDHTVSYDDNECYVNDKALPNEDTKKSSVDMSLELKKTFYNTFMKRHFKHLVVLCSAGTSMDNGGKETNGKSRSELWKYCQDEINAFEQVVTDFKSKTFYETQDIEECLSFIILYEKLNGVLENKNKESLRELLEAKIVSACNLELQSQAPHKEFLKKLTSRKPVTQG